MCMCCIAPPSTYVNKACHTIRRSIFMKLQSYENQQIFFSQTVVMNKFLVSSNSCANSILVMGSVTGLFPLRNGARFLNDYYKVNLIGQWEKILVTVNGVCTCFCSKNSSTRGTRWLWNSSHKSSRIPLPTSTPQTNFRLEKLRQIPMKGLHAHFILFCSSIPSLVFFNFSSPKALSILLTLCCCISRSAHRTPNFTNPEFFVCLLLSIFSR
jgi:hypothetical protein